MNSVGEVNRVIGDEVGERRKRGIGLGENMVYDRNAFLTSPFLNFLPRLGKV
jgi:hypothetical protein